MTGARKKSAVRAVLRGTWNRYQPERAPQFGDSATDPASIEEGRAPCEVNTDQRTDGDTMASPRQDDGWHIAVSASPASDGWGFVGVVRVGEVEAYRTLESYMSEREAEHTASVLIGNVLGSLLAGAEWSQHAIELDRLPRRTDYGFSRNRDWGRS